MTAIKVMIGLSVLLLLLGCGSSSTPRSSQRESEPAGELVKHQVMEGLEALEQRIVALERDLIETRWTTEDAQWVARDRLNKALKDCPADSPISTCNLYELMKGLTPADPRFMSKVAAFRFVREGEWSADRYDSVTWRVLVVDTSGWTAGFFVHERTGLMVGIDGDSGVP